MPKATASLDAFPKEGDGGGGAWLVGGKWQTGGCGHGHRYGEAVCSRVWFPHTHMHITCVLSTASDIFCSIIFIMSDRRHFNMQLATNGGI